MTGVRSPRGLGHRGRLGFLAKDAALYGGAGAISKAFSLITFPLIARHFSTDEYGVIDFFGVLASFLGVLIVFGQDSAIARFFYEYEGIQQRRLLISQSLLFQLLLSSLVVVVLLFWATTLAPLLIDVPDASNYFTLIVIQAPFLVLMNFSQNLLKWTFKRNHFLLVSLGFTFSGFTLLLVGILVFNMGVAGIFWIGIINSALFALLGLWFVRKWLILPREWGYLRELLRFALPLGVICCVAAVVPTVERWLTIDLLGLESLGLYSAGTRVAMLLMLFVGAFQTAWGPFSLSLYKQNDAILTYNRVLKVFVLLMVFFAYALGAAAYPLITLLATERYVGGAAVVFPLALAFVIQATSWITEIGIGISKRSYLNLYAYVVYVLITVLCIYLFAQLLGLVGVALGVLLGFIARAATATWLAQKAYPMSWDFGGVIKYLSLSIFLGLAVLFLYGTYGELLGSVVFALVGLGLGIFGLLFLFSREERSSVLSMVLIYFNRKDAK